jgi:hypothetical protein
VTQSPLWWSEAKDVTQSPLWVCEAKDVTQSPLWVSETKDVTQSPLWMSETKDVTQSPGWYPVRSTLPPSLRRHEGCESIASFGWWYSRCACQLMFVRSSPCTSLRRHSVVSLYIWIVCIKVLRRCTSSSDQSCRACRACRKFRRVAKTALSKKLPSQCDTRASRSVTSSPPMNTWRRVLSGA